MRALTSLSTILTLTLALGACGDDGATTQGSGPTTNQPETMTGNTTGNTSTTDVGPTTGSPTEPGTSTGMTSVTTGATTDETATTMNATTGGSTDGLDTTAGSTDGEDTTAGDTGNSSGDVDTTTGGVGDPNWPAPDAKNVCPADFVAASFTMDGVVCSPECGAMSKCPKAETGTAQPACVFNPDSSGEECMKMGDKCPNMDECVMTGGGGMACLAPSDHCVLLCDGNKTCPDGMECFGKQICQFPL